MLAQLFNGIDALQNQNPNEAGKEYIEKTSASVIDREPEKYNGPPTEVIIRFSLADGDRSTAQNQALVGFGAQISSMMGVKLKEIKRGEPLRSTLSRSIPSGTKMFPIRLVYDSGTLGVVAGSSLTMLTGAPAGPDTLTADLYFYKDSFGEWNAIKKD
jgi:hypothetical protein